MTSAPILLVEDNPVTREGICFALAGAGYQVHEAHTAAQALELLARQRPALIIQDLQLPDMDGCELVLRLRALPAGRDVAVVGISGLLSPEHEQRVASAPFSAVLFKPLDPHQLLRTVEAHTLRPGAALPTPGRERRILVADDNPMQLELFRARLSQLGFVVELCRDGREALAAARVRAPDAVLTDVLMPGMDGFQLCLALRADDALSQIPVILVSSHYLEAQDRALADKVGASGFALRTAGADGVVAALLEALDSRAAPRPTGDSAVLELEHLQRAVAQLERQATINVGLVERCAIQGAALSVLSSIAEGLARDGSLAHALRDALHHCLDAAGLSAAALYLADGQLAPIPHLQVGCEALAGDAWREAFGVPELFRRAMQTQTLLVAPSALVPEPLGRAFLGRAGDATAALIAPLVGQQKPMGALVLLSTVRNFAGTDWRTFAVTVAGQLAQAMTFGATVERLRASEERSRTLMENALDGVCVLTLDGRILEANRRVEELQGLPRAELLGRSIFSLIAPETMESARPVFARLLTEGVARVDDVVLLRPDGTIQLVDISASVVDVESERLLFVTLRDASGRAEILDALRTSEERFRSLVDSLDDVVFTVGRDHRYTSVFGGYSTEARSSAPSYLGRSPSEILGPEIARPHDAAIDRALAGERVIFEWDFLHGGATRTFQTVVSPLRQSSGETVGVVGVTRDLTDQKRAQAQLLVSDRLASVGMLAAGVAHEINNPLASVIANLDLAARDLAEAQRQSPGASGLSEAGDELRDAREAADRVRQIVRDLRIFSRGGEEHRGAVDLRRILDSSLRMAWNEIKHRSRLVKDYGEAPPVESTESRLGQVFLNLVVNAAQSIEEGHAEAHEIRVTTRTDADGRAVVEISDTGSGMPPEVLRQLFTPFFTTKPVGQGTGLGLSICQRIVGGLGGEISVESKVGVGTTFRVVLPAARPDSGEQPRIALAVPDARRRGRVLVIDDEEMIGRTVRRNLSRDHDVVALTSAREALERLATGERFDVILCDLMMPEMTGMELHDELKRKNPELAQQMIFLSGGAFTPKARAFLDRVPNLRVEKPFDLQQIRALVNERIR